MTALLCAGGELAWKAGPLAKGAGLCHGTAGNAFAFLKLLRRTGDERWLGAGTRVRDACHRTGRCPAGAAEFPTLDGW